MTTMRAKLQVGNIVKHESGHETISFHGVAKSDGYPADGKDEDNTFARWSPSVALTITIANPDLWGKFKVGDKFYTDFSPAT